MMAMTLSGLTISPNGCSPSHKPGSHGTNRWKSHVVLDQIFHYNISWFGTFPICTEDSICPAEFMETDDA